MKRFISLLLALVALFGLCSCGSSGSDKDKPKDTDKESSSDVKNDENKDILRIAKEILTNAAKYVKIGGELVFSTCTVNRDENEDRLKEFLEENKGFEIVDFSCLLPDALKKDTAKDGYVTFYPNIDNIDGFFIAKLKRCK